MRSRIGALALLGMLLLVMIALSAVAAEENWAVGNLEIESPEIYSYQHTYSHGRDADGLDRY